MKNKKDLAVIYRVIVNDNDFIKYIPVDVIEGIYDEENKRLYDKKGTPYLHIIYTPDSYGFALRRNICEYKKNYPKLPLFLIKKKILHVVKKNICKSGVINNEDDNIPAILCGNDEMDYNNIFLDTDIIIYYLENYPDMIDKIIKDYNLDIDIEKSEKKTARHNRRKYN